MRRILVAAVIAALAVSGCRREAPAELPQPRPAAVANDAGSRIVRRIESDVTSLDYLLQLTDDDRHVMAYLHDSLIDLDQKLTPIPAIAASWTIEDGGKTYVFQIDPRATFSDGKPIRAADVVHTLNRIVDEDAAQFAEHFDSLDRANTKATGERTVRVAFREPRAAQLLSFNVAILPQHAPLAKNGMPVTSGPYVVKSRERGRSLTLVRRKDYWRERPRVETVIFRVLTDDTVAWKAMLRGDLDVTPIDNDTWFRVKDDPAVTAKITFYKAWIGAYNCIVWNTTNPLFADPRIRRALAMSFDRQTVIDSLYHGEARAVTGPFMPGQWAHNDEVIPVGFNLPAASALLSSAGWNDTNGDGVRDRAGKPFEFTLLLPAGNRPAIDQSQILQDALQSIGVKMTVTPLDTAALFEHVLQRNFESAFLAWGLEPDPDPFSNFHSSQIAPEGMNLSGYSSPEADELIASARSELDRPRRAELYHQLHEVLARDQPYLWTVQFSSKWAVNRRVRDVAVADGMGLFLWNPGPRGWWLDPKPSPAKR